MKEYIEKADAINLLWLFADESCASVVSDFEGLPAADVAEVRYAFWSDYGSGVCLHKWKAKIYRCLSYSCRRSKGKGYCGGLHPRRGGRTA